MILVTLGTQDKPFNRLLENIEKEIEKGNIKDEVIVQAGYTKYQSKNMEIYDLLDRDEFQRVINKCDLLITHGGVGSILSGLKNNKKIIVAPRLSKYGEHMNDHQLQIVNNFVEEGYIIGYYDGDDLASILKRLNEFKPKQFISNTQKVVSIIEEFIDNN